MKRNTYNKHVDKLNIFKHLKNIFQSIYMWLLHKFLNPFLIENFEYRFYWIFEYNLLSDIDFLCRYRELVHLLHSILLSLYHSSDREELVHFLNIFKLINQNLLPLFNTIWFYYCFLSEEVTIWQVLERVAIGVGNSFTFKSM